MLNADYLHSVMEGETAIRPPILQAGRVTNVNHHTHTYDVETDNKYNLVNLPAMYPYVSNEYGQGINFIAEVGTRCLVCNTLNGEDFILGWLVPIGTASVETITNPDNVSLDEVEQKNSDSYPGRAGNRSTDLLPGDFEFSTASGSKVRVLNGGVIEIVAQDGLCSTTYIALTGESAILTQTDIIETTLGAGSLKWTTDNTNRTGNLYFELRSNIDSDPDVSVEIGSISEDDNARLIVKVGTLDSPDSKITISKTGELTIECKSIDIKSKKNAKINCKNATIKATSRVKIISEKIELN